MVKEKDNIDDALAYLMSVGESTKIYVGWDNTKMPKTHYLKKVIGMTDKELANECERRIWLAAYAQKNIKADYHYQRQACQDECKRRGKINIYEKAQREVAKKEI